MRFSLKKLGPGLLFAGAAIGVSHLVQSTRAGADFGYGLIWALLLAHAIKYPFFQFGPKYALATGETLLDGYRKLGKGVLIAYYIITFATMFTIQTAVTIVTAGLAKSIFGSSISSEVWTIIILLVCMIILLKGKYHFLDRLMKIIIITLTISTIIAVFVAFQKQTNSLSIEQIIPQAAEFGFLIAFMGWMPAPLDISVWHSIWAIEKQKDNSEFTAKSSLYDFNIGYMFTVIIGLGFLSLGALVMFQTEEVFSNKAGEFANQLINMYTTNLGDWAYIIIGVAAFTTMFSTTLTTLDASPRAMNKTTELLFGEALKTSYLFWILLLITGTVLIYFFFASEMGLLIKIATILSFLTAPFYAIINYKLICSKHTPQQHRPTKLMHLWSLFGIAFLIGFGIWYLTTFFN